MSNRPQPPTSPTRAVPAWRKIFGFLMVAALLTAMPASLSGGGASAQMPNAQSDASKWPMQMKKAKRTVKQKGAMKSSPLTPAALKNAPGTKSRVSKARTNQGPRMTEYYVLNVEFRDAASRRAQFADAKTSRIAGAHVLTVIDRFADLFITGDAPYNAIVQRPDVVRVEVVTAVEVPPPPPGTMQPVESKAVADRIVRGGFQGMTGKGVVVAIVDTGVDFRHPDFITYDAAGNPRSRLLYLWDTATPHQNGRGSRAPFSFPNKTSIGTLYTQDQLTAALVAEKGGRRSNIPATDENGHGTACAGIAAGNGNGLPAKPASVSRNDVLGVAPDADIIAIRLGQNGLENSYLLNAASEWMDKVAGAKPLVVSCSFGGHGSGHDGETIEQRQLNVRYPLNKPGRAIVIAAGNEGTDPIHAEAAFGNQANAKLVRWEGLEGAYINIYFDTGEEGITIAPAGQTQYEFMGWDFNPFTNQWGASIKLGADGIGGLWLFNDSGNRMKAHLYSPSSDNMGRPAAVFAPDVVAYASLVGEPGTTSNAITAGSYDWNDNFHTGGNAITLMQVCENAPLEIGKISCYSSPGPTRTDKVKPEIVAPGEWYAASYAKIPGQGGVPDWRFDTTGNYATMNGTSAATPYTAGVVALMFQKKPTLTLGEVRNLLTSKASRDAFTGAVPNKTWGYGKLDFNAIQRIFAAI